MSRRTLLALALSLGALFALLLLPACKKNQEAASPPPQTPEASRDAIADPATPTRERFRLGLIRHPAAASAITAQARDHFAQHNLALTLSLLDSSSAVAQALANGEIDAGILFPLDALTSPSFVVPLVLARNAGSISVTQELWSEIQGDLLKDTRGRPLRPVHADALLLPAQTAQEQTSPLRFQIDAPQSTAALALRYWLAAGGLTPQSPETPSSDAVTILLTTPPPPSASPPATQNPSFQGQAGERWRTPANHVEVIAIGDVMRDLPSAVLATSEETAASRTDPLLRTLAALIQAGLWLDASQKHRLEATPEVARTLKLPLAAVTAALTGSADPRPQAPRLTFAENGSGFPDRSSAAWLLEQAARWNPAAPQEPSDLSTLRPDLFRQAVERSQAGPAALGNRLQDNAPLDHVIDGNHFQPPTQTPDRP